MYNYEEEKKWLFTDEGQRAFLKVRDHVQEMLKDSGAVMIGSLWNAWVGMPAISYQALACIDRMKELHEVIEIQNPISSLSTHQILIAAH